MASPFTPGRPLSQSRRPSLHRSQPKTIHRNPPPSEQAGSEPSRSTIHFFRRTILPETPHRINIVHLTMLSQNTSLKRCPQSGKLALAQKTTLFMRRMDLERGQRLSREEKPMPYLEFLSMRRKRPAVQQLSLPPLLPKLATCGRWRGAESWLSGYVEGSVSGDKATTQKADS